MPCVYTRRQALQLMGATAAARLRAATEKPLRGIFPIMATPFTPANQVDYEDLAKEVDFMDRCGAHGMVWPQLASEYKFLSREERRRGMRVLARAANGKRPALVLGVQGATKRDALEYAELAEELAPDALIAIPPTEAKTLDDFRDYYRALADITHRPFFIQTSGGAPDINPTVEFLIEMGREFPHFGYVKEEHSPIYERIPALAAARPAIKRVFSGPVGLYEMRVGCDGCMPEALYPDIDVQMWDLYHSGQEAKAREIFSKRLLLVYTAEHIAGTRPYIMKKRGVFKHAFSRRESTELTPAAVREIDFEFEGLRPYLKV
ncbi:MAG TPA: dihydrodipicolinate synthase family protein [Bryobacteraceae bacterium]|nr:dihydrodipicolinate synthase family protein [Bryobacteraceae bacterium]